MPIVQLLSSKSTFSHSALASCLPKTQHLFASFFIGLLARNPSIGLLERFVANHFPESDFPDDFKERRLALLQQLLGKSQPAVIENLSEQPQVESQKIESTCVKRGFTNVSKTIFVQFFYLFIYFNPIFSSNLSGCFRLIIFYRLLADLICRFFSVVQRYFLGHRNATFCAQCCGPSKTEQNKRRKHLFVLVQLFQSKSARSIFLFHAV